MYKSLIDAFFGRPIDFSDGLFNEKKSLMATVGSKETEVSDDKYVFNFAIGDKVDLDCLNVSVKGNLLTVSYEKDDENGSYVKTHFTRSLPKDADIETMTAELNEEGDNLSVTVKRKELPAEKKSKEIPVKFED